MKGSCLSDQKNKRNHKESVGTFYTVRDHGASTNYLRADFNYKN